MNENLEEHVDSPLPAVSATTATLSAPDPALAAPSARTAPIPAPGQGSAGAFAHVQPPPNAVPFLPMGGATAPQFSPPPLPSANAGETGTFPTAAYVPSTPASAPAPVPAAVLTPHAPTSDEDAVEFGQGECWHLPFLQKGVTKTKVFTLAGRRRKITISCDGRTDADTFYKFMEAMQGGRNVKRDKNGLPLLEPIAILTPDGQMVRISERSAILNLMTLAAIVVQPKWCVDEWACLCAAVGPLGVAPGEHGLNHIVTWALEENGLTPKQLLGDEQRAGEGAQAADSPTA